MMNGRKGRLLLMVVAVTIGCFLYEVSQFYCFQSAYTAKLQRGASDLAYSRLTSKSVSNLDDWSFIKIIECPKFSPIGQSSKQKGITKGITLQCRGEKSTILSRTISDNDHLPVPEIPFGDKCLLDAINNLCLEGRAVPNVVHYVWYNNHSMEFFQFLSFMSALRFVKPCLILIHGPFLPHGKYWDHFVSVFPKVIHVRRNHTKVVGKNKLAFPQHGSDVMRIEALYEYGGVYLDWDEVVLRSVDKLRDYNLTVGLERTNYIGSQFIMAKKGASFLHLWHNCYETKYQRDWVYNALIVPFELSRKFPRLVHIEGNRFTRPHWTNRHLIFNQNYDWSDNYAMHLFSRWYKKPIDENKIRLLNTTIGSISRHVLFGNKELCKPR